MVCVDPSEAMLAQVPEVPRLVRARVGRASDRRSGRVTKRRYDAVLVKEAIHHVAERSAVLRGLAALLTSGGRLLVVMLPKSIRCLPPGVSDSRSCSPIPRTWPWRCGKQA